MLDFSVLSVFQLCAQRSAVSVETLLLENLSANLLCKPLRSNILVNTFSPHSHLNIFQLVSLHLPTLSMQNPIISHCSFLHQYAQLPYSLCSKKCIWPFCPPPKLQMSTPIGVLACIFATRKLLSTPRTALLTFQSRKEMKPDTLIKKHLQDTPTICNFFYPRPLLSEQTLQYGQGLHSLETVYRYHHFSLKTGTTLSLIRTEVLLM